MKILATKIQSMKLANTMKSSDVAHIGVYCQICGSPSHYAEACPVIGSDDNNGNQEDANFTGQNNQGAGPGYGPPTNRWDNPNRNNLNPSYKRKIKHLRASHTNSSRAMHRISHEANTTFELKSRITLPISRSLSTTTSHKGSKIRIQVGTRISRSSPSNKRLADHLAWRP
ncbi:unnamed protein product [Rhodiola kirilowii]